jgi:hypothetical protein
MADQRGLIRKWNVSRVDGSTEHEACRVFVLDPQHDQHARAALFAYAQSCEAEHPVLAAELLAWADQVVTADDDVVDAEIDYREWYSRLALQRLAAFAIHHPCHTADTEPYGCEHGHQGFDEDTGSISGVPDQPAECMACTYDDRTYTWPCPTAQALGVTA